MSFKHLPTFVIVIILAYLISGYTINQVTSTIEFRYNDNVKVEMLTTHGKIILQLSDKTPMHRDNFVKLVNEKKYDSLLFHRVIQSFMIQSGDPESKMASGTDTLGMGDLEYKVPAEFDDSLFHKKGALAAARDGNPERASSAMQFYIVQGRTYNDSTLGVAEERINGWLAEYYARKNPDYKKWVDSLDSAMEQRDIIKYNAIADSLKNKVEFDKYRIPEEHRNVYKSKGGAAHLDQNYTVFGEVLSGFEVVDSIAAIPVDKFNRPLRDARIISMKIISD